MTKVPEQFYGVLQQSEAASCIDETVEQVRVLGYASLDSGYPPSEIKSIAEEFDSVRRNYIKAFGDVKLRETGELFTVRAMLTHGSKAFLDLLLNKNLNSLLKRLIQGRFFLHQQNGVINPPEEPYGQGAWHRDLPYQHFVTTKPLAINALYCVDDFTLKNGATFVLPASHLSENFPTNTFIKKNAIQIEAKAGTFIILDCMLFHSGGTNFTNQPRRAVNHVFSIPYFKQQISIPKILGNVDLPDEVKQILGFGDVEPESVSDYLEARLQKRVQSRT